MQINSAIPTIFPERIESPESPKVVVYEGQDDAHVHRLSDEKRLSLVVFTSNHYRSYGSTKIPGWATQTSSPVTISDKEMARNCANAILDDHSLLDEGILLDRYTAYKDKAVKTGNEFVKSFLESRQPFLVEINEHGNLVINDLQNKGEGSPQIGLSIIRGNTKIDMETDKTGVFGYDDEGIPLKNQEVHLLEGDRVIIARKQPPDRVPKNSSDINISDDSHIFSRTEIRINSNGNPEQLIKAWLEEEQVERYQNDGNADIANDLINSMNLEGARIAKDLILACVADPDIFPTLDYVVSKFQNLRNTNSIYLSDTHVGQRILSAFQNQPIVFGETQWAVRSRLGNKIAKVRADLRESFKNLTLREIFKNDVEDEEDNAIQPVEYSRRLVDNHSNVKIEELVDVIELIRTIMTFRRPLHSGYIGIAPTQRQFFVGIVKKLEKKIQENESV